MALVATQSDFRSHLKDYLDRVNDDGETIYIARSRQRGVAVLSQEKLDWLEKAAFADKKSVEYAIAMDKLKEEGVIPDNDPELTGSDYEEYWK
ncbi:type II toxin-antitoxin system prevent-host-death family antitoxin [Lactobacillus hamsteri]|uniref:Antitoxin n=1 Tax=Lactobacillus hamsteri DSM 5661 = JCM 6256 TaxID=1423754 RepID=A0A0R1YJP9_9LACO|nr:type II toxin-antitoxin system prevent-host-death family antitoxin [Lactobacillus hamsteri]KRM40105.1 hypothetical protein FC39_GL000840 [Lactobacillus hamsteri DSM 5661 = JCM 6256]